MATCHHSDTWRVSRRVIWFIAFRARSLKSGRGEKIRTSDPLYPKQVRYQAAPRPDRVRFLYPVRGKEKTLYAVFLLLLAQE